MAIKTNKNFIPFSNNVTFMKPRTRLLSVKVKCPDPGVASHDQKPDSGDSPKHQIPSPCPHSPHPHGIYIDRCINISTPLTFCAFSKLTPQIYCKPHSCGMNIQRFSILYRGPKIWISLPSSLTNSSSTFVFFKKSWNYLIDGHSVAY